MTDDSGNGGWDGYTTIYDTDGSMHRIKYEPRKRRKSPRALRFANLKVGDQLVLKPAPSWYRRGALYIVITDLWFDPVAGQFNETAGRMVGYRQIGPDGESRARKSATTLRGLASLRYQYADIDYIALCKDRLVAMTDGAVVGIGMGNVIRRRPKLPGHSL